MMLDKRKAIIKKTQKQRERMAEWREGEGERVEEQESLRC